MTGTSAPEQPPQTGGHSGSHGILGGTFNPPHLGHVALARGALQDLGLERVWLMPVHTPVHKPGERDPGPEHRLRMCRLAVAGIPGVGVCAMEVERGGRSYTVETLRAIHSSHPHARLTFIVGADTAATLPSWREPLAVLELADLAVAARAGTARQRVLETIAQLPEPAGAAAPPHARVRFLAMPTIDVSSSRARELARSGAPTAGLVGDAVAGYIEEHGLYRDTVREGR